MNWQDLIDNQIEIKAGTAFVAGLVGGHAPSKYSKSSKIWNAALKRFGIDATYLPFDVSKENLAKFVAAIKKDKRLRGFNVTVPYKRDIIGYLDDLDSLTREIQAVNTVVVREGKLHGLNTDGAGLVAALEEEFGSIEGKNVLQIGAGEAGNAVAHSLAEHCAHLWIVNRNVERARALTGEVNKRAGIRAVCEAGDEDMVEKWLPNADIIINVSVKGFGEMGQYSALWPTGPDNLKKSEELMRKIPEKVVFADIIFAPAETVMLRQARKSGHRTQNGLGMLVHQAALAFEKIFATEVKEKQIDHGTIVATMREAL